MAKVKMKSVKSKDEITDQLESFLNKINKIFLSQKHGKNVAFLQDNQARTSSSQILSLLNFAPDNRLENIFKQIIFDYAIKAEKISADSSLSMINFLLDFFIKKKKNNAFDLEKEKESILEEIQQSLRRPTRKDYDAFLEKNFSSIIGEVVSEAYNLAGPAGKIIFEHGNIPNPIIELSKTYQFSVQPEINILMANEGTWKKSNVKVFCVEGFIEKVSEIDCILSEAARRNSSVLIVCLGCAHEVVSTIVTNNARKVFDVAICHPVNDRTSINDIFDIATVSSATLFDYQNPIATSFDAESFSDTSDEISIIGEKLMIRNSSSTNAANRKVRELRKRLEETEADLDLEVDYIRKRIRSLTSNQVKILLPEKNSQEKFNEIEKIDRTLRCIKSFVKYGTFKGDELSSSVYVGCVYAYDLYEILSSIETAIVYE
jgi:hypothetical protein